LGGIRVLIWKILLKSGSSISCKQEVNVVKKKTIAIASFFVIGILLLGAITAYRGDSTIEGPNHNPETHEQMETAMEAGDYAGYMQIREENGLPTRGKIFQVLNEENFYKFLELREANTAGDIETAAQIMEELGVSQGRMNNKRQPNAGEARGYGMKSGFRQGDGRGKMQGNAQNRMQNFVTAGNDGTWDNL